MAKDNKIRLPSSGGGLVSYYEEGQSKLTFKPAHVVIFTVVVIFLVLILYNSGYILLGIK